MTHAEVLGVSQISKRFGAFWALREVSLVVGTGEVHAIIGPNGAGKTTLINVITRQTRPTTGAVYLSGKKIDSLSPHRIAQLGLLRTFQISNLFTRLSVRQNIGVGLIAARKFAEQSRGRDRELAERSNILLEFLGFQSIAELPVEEISHGDQRMLEIGLVLAAEPRVVLMDEPTAGMSPAETSQFVRLLNSKLRNAVTIVLVEHDMKVVTETADRITVLANGEVLAQGTADEIATDAAVQEVYLGRAVNS